MNFIYAEKHRKDIKMKKIEVKSTLGDIVTAYPNTAKIMNRYKIDYCCGGKDILGEVLDKLSLDHETVIKELQTEADSINLDEVVDWKNETLTKIIDYIINKHHVFMRETLDELNMLMFKILKVHYHTDGESLLVVHKLFGTLKTELEEHLVKEEENLFPLIEQYEISGSDETKEKIYKFITDTENEHDAAGDLLKQLEIATNDFTAPDHACYSYKRTFELLDALEKDTFNHIHMENSILFSMI